MGRIWAAVLVCLGWEGCSWKAVMSKVDIRTHSFQTDSPWPACLSPVPGDAVRPQTCCVWVCPLNVSHSEVFDPV